MDGQSDLTEHLAIYLQGFEDYEGAYSPYPDALFYIRFMVSVGKIILKKFKKPESAKITIVSSNLDTNTHTTTEHLDNLDRNKIEELKDKSDDANEEKNSLPDNLSELNMTKSKKAFMLSSFVWQAIHLFLSIERRKKSDVLDTILEGLFEYSLNITLENWYI